jgi:hypothetical protein
LSHCRQKKECQKNNTKSYNYACSHRRTSKILDRIIRSESGFLKPVKHAFSTHPTN